MHVLITGAAGMIGRKITEKLLETGELNRRPISKLTLHDIVAPDAEPTPSTSILPIAGDIADPVVIDRLVAEKPDLVLHLAAIVSGEAASPRPGSSSSTQNSSRVGRIQRRLST